MNRSLGEVDVDCYGPEDSARSDEQAQSQDRERLQSEIEQAFDNLLSDHYAASPDYQTSDADIRLLKWRLGIR